MLNGLPKEQGCSLSLESTTDESSSKLLKLFVGPTQYDTKEYFPFLPLLPHPLQQQRAEKMKLKDLTLILKKATDAGAEKALEGSGILQEFLSKSEAYHQYGRTNVDRWIHEGLLVPQSAKGKILHKCIDRVKLEAIAHSSNRVTYLPVAER
mgnify:CR=1 FL=1